jgi:hypothetical protein
LQGLAAIGGGVTYSVTLALIQRAQIQLYLYQSSAELAYLEALFYQRKRDKSH